MDEKKFDKRKYIIVILLMVICLAVGCIIGKILLSGKNACLENAVIDEVDYKDDSEVVLTYSEATDSSIGCSNTSRSCPTTGFITNTTFIFHIFKHYS